MKTELRYNSNFSDIITIKELKKRAFINALSFTKTLAEAALELGVSERTVHLFCEEYQIDRKKQEELRLKFKVSGKKVKKRF